MLNRMANRWKLAIRFSREGSGLVDKARLFVAGVARGRAFDQKSIYGRTLFALFPTVTARIGKLNDYKISFDLSDYVDTLIFEELVLEGIYPLNDIPFEPDLVIDAGACRGLFTLMVSPRYPNAKYVCFEPEPHNFERLRQHLKLNSVVAETHRCVVSDSDEPVMFDGWGFGGAITKASDKSSAIAVPAKRLDEFLRTARPNKLLLKMDIEGAEESVLPQILEYLPSTTAIFLETHQTDCDKYLEQYRRNGFVGSVIRKRAGEDAKTEYVEWFFIRDQGTDQSKRFTLR